MVPAFLNFLAIPIVINNAGAEIYGFVTLILSIFTIQVLVDIGLINTFFPVYVKKIYSKEFAEAREIFTSTIVRVALYSSLSSILILPPAVILIQKFAVNSSQELKNSFTTAIYIVILSNVFGGLVNFTSRILLIYGRNRLNSILNSTSNSLVSISLIFCSFLNSPLIPMTIGVAFIPIIISSLTFIWISKIENLVDFRRIIWNASRFKFNIQMGNWLVQAMAILGVPFDAVILALYSDSYEVARFGVISKVSLFIVTVYAWTTSSESVKLIEIESEGKIIHAQNQIINSLKTLLRYFTLLIIPAIILLKIVLEFLTTDKFYFSYLEVTISILWTLSLIISTMMSRVMFAKGVFSGYFQMAMIGAVLNIATTFWLCRQGLGIVGPFLATIIATLVFSLPYFFYSYKKSLRR